jgi:hypothetical protein
MARPLPPLARALRTAQYPLLWFAARRQTVTERARLLARRVLAWHGTTQKMSRMP